MSILVASPKAMNQPGKLAKDSRSFKNKKKNLLAILGIILAAFTTSVMVFQSINLAEYSSQLLRNLGPSHIVSVRGICNDLVRQAQKELLKRLPSLPPRRLKSE